MEDYGLLVEYGSRGGDLTAKNKMRRLAGALDYYLIVHRSTTYIDGGLDFRCNKAVTPQNFPGRATVTTASETPRCTQAVMYDVPYRGPTRAFHINVVSFGIQR